MGLGGAAEGGTVVLALMLLLGAVIVAAVLYLAVRAITGRRRPAFVSAGAWCGLVLALCGTEYLSADARAQRHAQSLRDDVVAAAGERLGGSAGGRLVDDQSMECPPRSGQPRRSDGTAARGWLANGSGTTEQAGVLDRFTAALQRDGYTTTPVTPPLDQHGKSTRPPQRQILAVRGSASVVVVVLNDTPNHFYVEAEDGCLTAHY